MKRTLSFTSTLLLVGCAAALAADRPPNIVVILRNDFGYGVT